LKGKNSPAKRLALLGLLASLALIFSYVEVLLPFHLGIVGVKLGLANLVVVLTLYLWSDGPALMVNLVRILLAGLLFGSGVSLAYSLGGGLASFGVMALAKRRGGLGVLGVSVLGGVFHNMGQLSMAMLLLRTPKLLYYLPVLLLAGLITGLLIGIAARRLIWYVARLDRIGLK
jgi:heptaprenyl diphosphate synthase